MLFTKELKHFGLKVSVVHAIFVHFEHKIYKDFELYQVFMTVFKLQSMFCGQMCVKLTANTQVTMQSYVCFNLAVYRPSFPKNIGFTSKISM